MNSSTLKHMLDDEEYISERYSSRSRRVVRERRLPYHLERMFHAQISHFPPLQEGEEKKRKKILPLTSAPPFVYFIDSFITSKEVGQLEDFCARNSTAFDTSFTQKSENLSEKVKDPTQRTSTFIALRKSQDRLIRSSFPFCLYLPLLFLLFFLLYTTLSSFLTFFSPLFL